MSNSTIRIPAPLRSTTNGEDEVSVEGATVREALKALGDKHEDILSRLLDANGDVRNFINIYLGEDNIRTLDGIDTAVSDGAILSIVPAVAGGLK